MDASEEISFDEDESMDRRVIETDQKPRSDIIARTVRHEESEEMEEGEIGDPEEKPKSPLYSKKVRSGLQITIDNSGDDSKEKIHLPDLLREIGPSGAETLDRTVTERMDARAKRFNLKNTGISVNYDDVIKLYASFGIPGGEYDGTIDASERKYRLEAIQMTGLKLGTTAEDLLEFFGDFTPGSYEWESPTTCNVIWAMKITAARALLCLSRPVSARKFDLSGGDVSDADDELVDVRHAEDNVNSDDEMEDFEQKTIDEIIDIEQKKKKRQKLLEKFNGPCDTEIVPSEIGADVPAGGTWRYARPGTSLGDSVFMRIPLSGFPKRLSMSSGSFGRQKELITTGGIWTTSRKMKVQEALKQEKEFQMEFERRKKYNGPVGKNPWGPIAQDWTKMNKGQQLDFAAELELFKDLRGSGGGGGFSGGAVGGGVGGFDRRRLIDRRKEIGSKKDWDAPENFDENVVTRPMRTSLKRMRSEVDEFSDDETFFDKGDDDERWNKKLKRPRMTMVADEEETKISAKRRILTAVKRRIRHPEKVEIYEEEVEDGERSDEEIDEPTPPPRRVDKFSFQVETPADRHLTSPSKRLSERFLNRLGARLEPRRERDRERERERFEPRRFDRLPFRGHDSGDGLERDTGEDLRAELDGKHAANMVIQITRSPKRDEVSDEEMETDNDDDESSDDDDDDDDEDEVQKSRPHSVVKVKQEPIRIKNEKEEEDRKKKRREEEHRKRENDESRKREEEKRRNEELESRRRAVEAKRRKEESVKIKQEKVSEKSKDEKSKKTDRKREDDRKKGQAENEIELLKIRRKGPAPSSGEVRKPSAVAKKKVIKSEPGTKKTGRGGVPVRIKKERKSDDSSSDSSDDDDDDSSSSDSSSSSSESSSSSSESSSSSSSSSASSSDSSTDDERSKKKPAKKPVKKMSDRSKKSTKDASDKKSSSDKKASDSRKKTADEGDKLKDKLKEYLNKARERRKKQ